jgi:hypothetical protein
MPYTELEDKIEMAATLFFCTAIPVLIIILLWGFLNE